MADNKYNGWKNYETWCVNLWMDESNTHYRAIIDAILKQNPDLDEDGQPWDAICKFADYIKTEHLDDKTRILEDAGQQNTVFDSLLGAALSEVDWREIAEAWICE